MRECDARHALADWAQTFDVTLRRLPLTNRSEAGGPPPDLASGVRTQVDPRLPSYCATAPIGRSAMSTSVDWSSTVPAPTNSNWCSSPEAPPIPVNARSPPSTPAM